MFDPPRVMIADTWAELPAALRVTSPRLPWRSVRFSRDLPSFLEGPAFDRRGRLYVADVAHGRVLRIDDDGGFHVVAAYDGEPNGLCFHRDGSLYIADFRNGILRLEVETGAITAVLRDLDGKGLKGPNDLTFADNGDLYFTDQGFTSLADPTGRLIRLRADGSVDVVLDGIPSPNGLAIDRRQTTLFLAVTRANAIWRVPLTRPGEVSKVGVAIQLSGGNGPDGLAMDEADNLYVAQNKTGCVSGFSYWGLPLFRIESSRGIDVTNLAFRPGTGSLFITESSSGSILRAELEIRGLPLFSHA